jgi:hypothetical protein
MAGVKITIPGQRGMIETKAAALAAAVQWHWNVATAKSETKVRPTIKQRP